MDSEVKLSFHDTLLHLRQYKFSEFKVAHQARRHSRSLVFGVDVPTDWIITKTNEPPMPAVAWWVKNILLGMIKYL